jgi:hypothetical protein
MAVKTLDVSRSCGKSELLHDIRKSDGRKLVLQKVEVRPLPGRKTVLSLKDKFGGIGVIRAKTQAEASRLQSAKDVALTISWDKNRNEQVMANFAY